MDRTSVAARSFISNKSSTTSSVAMAAATARAKAEAAQARAAFSEREIRIKTEKARLDALDALERERKAEAAMAEAAVMEAVDEHRPLLQSVQTAQQRTEEYVNRHSHHSDSTHSHQETSSRKVKTPHNFSPISQCEGQEDKFPTPDCHQPNSHSADSTVPTINRFTEESHPQLLNSLPHYERGLPAYTPQFNDPNPYMPRAPHQSNDIVTSDLAKYLARSQLVSSGLTSFDDKPDNYLSWKGSFINTIEGLDLKASEEMDLLIKWLGAESAEHARRIKSVNVRNPSAGLCLIWERLDEMYGSPEAIKGALFTKLEKFPKIAPKEHHKLRELSDLLIELEFAKQEGYLPGLSYLDTARGVNPGVKTAIRTPGQVDDGGVTVQTRT